MQLIKSASNKSFFSEALYIILNLVLVASVLGLVRLFDPPYLAYVLVLLAKWRIFAVRPRYWLMNIKTNVVDLLVGLSTVTILSQSNDNLPFQILIALLYAAWLLVLKPRSKRSPMVMQAAIAQFAALTALSSFSHLLPSSVFVIGCLIIGYAVARHTLSAYEEDTIELLALVYGFVLAELGWLYYHWMVAYPLVELVAVPQLAITTLLISFVIQRLYETRKRHGKVTPKDIRVPVLFMAAVLVVLWLRFTPWSVVL